jgi:hypothetical protein
LHLTPAILAAGYDYLRATPPFNRWKLPPSEEISWHVINKAPHVDGFCTSFKNGTFRIEVNARKVKVTDTLLPALAHEACHVRLFSLGVKAHHGYAFKKLAKSVCRQHGWREELF